MNRIADYNMKIFYCHGFARLHVDKVRCYTSADAPQLQNRGINEFCSD